jgi:hypothetical protein
MYTDRNGVQFTDRADILDIVSEELEHYEMEIYPYVSVVHAVDNGAANGKEAVSLANAYLAPLWAFPNVGLSSDYCESAYLIAGDLGEAHVVVYDESHDNDERPYTVLHHPGGEDDHPQTVAGPFASPAEAIEAAREFAASIGLV